MLFITIQNFSLKTIVETPNKVIAPPTIEIIVGDSPIIK